MQEAKRKAQRELQPSLKKKKSLDKRYRRLKKIQKMSGRLRVVSFQHGETFVQNNIKLNLCFIR